MERKRYEKMFLILILVVAIAGMSLGFAAFSKVLTINASATVTPSQDDFKIVAYGAIDAGEIAKLYSGQAPDLTKWSTTESYQVDANGTFVTDENETFINKATISYVDNQINIDGVKAEFLDSDMHYYYAFAIRNEGFYKAKLTLSEDTLNKLVSRDASGSCTPEVEEDAAIVGELCDGIHSYSSAVLDASFNDITESLATGYELDVNDYIIIVYTIENNNTTSFVEAGLKGGFTVQFTPIQIIFDSVA